MPRRPSCAHNLAILAIGSSLLTACSGGLAHGALPPTEAATSRLEEFDAPAGAKVPFTVRLHVPENVRAKSIEISFAPATGGSTLKFYSNVTPSTNELCKG